MKITKKGAVCTLTLKKTDPSDSGQYQCFAQNDAGECTTEANIVIDAKPQVLRKLKDLVIKVDEQLLLETQFKGFPEPEITWYKDEEPLSKEHARKEDDNDLFEIKNAKLEHSGGYSAVAKNSVGECKTSAKVKVIQAPFFEKDLADITVIENKTLRLEATILGSPYPEVEWMKDAKPLSSKKSGADKFSFKKDGNCHSLTVAKVTHDAEGVFSITAKNQAGEAKCQAAVTVHGKNIQIKYFL